VSKEKERVYKVSVFCEFCGDITEVEFLLPPNDEEKTGWICETCATELKKYEN
jgi:hypothetical protein